MTELVARIPRSRALAPALTALLLLTAAAVAGALALRTGSSHVRSHPRASAQVRPVPPLDVAPPAEPEPPAPAPAAKLPTAAIEAGAARAFARPFFVSSSRGVFATARRVAAWRHLALRAAEGTTVDARLLESLIYVESSGNAGAIAGNRAGLTQLTPAQARSVGLHVNVRRSRNLTRAIGWWAHHGNYREARRLARVRARVDRRFAALAELRGTVRYLERAKRSLGRLDLAVASLHLGISGLRGTVERFGGEDVSYAQLYFGSAPDRRPSVYRRLTAHGDAAHDYWWRVLAARRVLGLYLGHPRRLAWEDRQQHRKNSAEEVLHPRPVAHEFHSPRALAHAWKRGAVVHFPRRIRRWHLRVERLGQMARTYGASPRLYRGLRPGAMAVLLELGRRVHQLGGGTLDVSSAVRDDRYQRALMQVNVNAARSYSLHTTGYTFDIARAPLHPRQERALVWVLDRLTALNAVAYITESGCYHVAVASRAVHELGLIRAAA